MPVPAFTSVNLLETLGERRVLIVNFLTDANRIAVERILNSDLEKFSDLEPVRLSR